MAAAADNAAVLPRVLIVSRRTVRKNKFVDFVGEYHLDLIVAYGAAPVIVPRVAGVRSLLPSFEPIHGVLLCEGEDIDPSLYDPSACDLSPEEIEEVSRRHRADSAGDSEKDSIELGLARLCLDRDVPFLGICRGAQVLNVAAGGTLYRDVETQLGGCVAHIDYGNYDGHRHKVSVVEESPIHEWFGELEIMVNSYHHQGVRRLGQGLLPMALAEDGLVEGFYDPDRYDPESGRFVVGLQFHPERMRRAGSEEFDHPGCPKAYQEFVKAVIAHQKKVSSCVTSPTSGLKLNQEMEKKRKIIVRSFSIAKNMYVARLDMPALKESELEAGAEFLELSSVLSSQQEKRLKQMGATVRNSSAYVERVKMNEEREAAARSLMGNMSIEQLSELLYFYHLMGLTCKEVLERKLMSTVER